MALTYRRHHFQPQKMQNFPILPHLVRLLRIFVCYRALFVCPLPDRDFSIVFYFLMVCSDIEPSRKRPLGQTIKQSIQSISFDHDLSSDFAVLNSFYRNLFDVLCMGKATISKL